MTRFCLIFLSGIILSGDIANAQTRTWRIGDAEHPWSIAPTTGRLTWGWGWSVEILVDDDNDGLIDEDPIELIDNDNDGLFNEDPVEPQVDNDGDGLLNEDKVDNLDNDGDGLIDEDPSETFDNDLDGLIDEDGPDPQIDNDGDGLLNEDGLMTHGDNDNDGLWNEDLPDGIDNDLDGLIDEDNYGLMTIWDDDRDGAVDEDPIDGIDNDNDGKIDEDGPAISEGPNNQITSWLRPIRLDNTRNLATLVNERYLLGELGGITPGKSPQNPFLVVPSEVGFRREPADPVSADNFGVGSQRTNYGLMVDGNLFTAFGAVDTRNRTPSFNFKGYYHINRVMFRPRPTVPNSTVANYDVRYGDQTSINDRQESISANRVFWPVVEGQANPVIKNLVIDESLVVGRLDINSRDPRELFVETAESQIFGEGYPVDASYTSKIIDVGTPTPRVRRYSREIEQFANSERSLYENEFPDVPGGVVNWGKVRWRGKLDGKDGNIRIQFRTGNSLDTHIYERRLGGGFTDTRDANGDPLDLFSWIKLLEGQVDERNLDYNEFGIKLGNDGTAGWSFWTAPFKFEDGLIDVSVPEDQWDQFGVELPLPGGTRYIQFRILFDSEQHSAVSLDFIEFEYEAPIVEGGVLAEIYPPQVTLGEETSFRFVMLPIFQEATVGGFNRVEIEVPDIHSHIDTLLYDGQLWSELPLDTLDPDTTDPLLDLNIKRLAPVAGSTDSIGQFTQTIAIDSTTGSAKLLLKLPIMRPEDFRFGENLEIIFSTTLFRGSKQFDSIVWNDLTSSRTNSIPQPVIGGDATPELSTNNLLVIVDNIGTNKDLIRLANNTLTPNGDGINDELKIFFDLFLVLEKVSIEVDILDLSGHAIHHLVSSPQTAGTVEFSWDGRNADGSTVAPGIYLYRLKVDSDDSSTEKIGTFSLVY